MRRLLPSALHSSLLVSWYNTCTGQDRMLMFMCFTPESIASSKPTITVQQAITTAENAIGGKYNNFAPTVEFFAKPDNTVVLTHVVQIRDEDAGIWVEAFVDAHENKVVSIVDFVTKASVSSNLAVG
jgi:hypothetical protein